MTERPPAITPSAEMPIPPQRGISLEWKLPLFIAALVLTVVIVATAAAYEAVASSAELGASERLRRAAHGFADLIERASAARAVEMARLADEPAVRSALAGRAIGADAMHALALEHFPADTPAVLVLVAADGRVAAATRDGLDEDQLLHARALFGNPRVGTLQNGEFYQRGDSVLFWSAAPVIDNGALRGWIAQRRRVASAPRVEAQLAEIMGGDARLYFVPESGEAWVTVAGSRIAPPDMRLQNSGLLQYIRDGERMVARAAAVSGAPYQILVELPRDVALNAPLGMLRDMAVFALMLLLAGVVGAWLVSRQVTAPLAELTDAAEAMARGESLTVSIRRGDEIGTLGAAFNLMAARVRDSHARLKRESVESQTLANRLASSNQELLRAQNDQLRAAERTQRLQAITAALSSSVTVEHVARAVIEEGIAALGATAGSVTLVDRDELVILRSDGYAESRVSRYRRMPLSAPYPLTEAVRTGKPIFVEGIDAMAERYPGLAADTQQRPGGSWVALPLIVDERVLGAIGINLPVREIVPEDRTFMLALAQQCAQALDRARLYVAEQEARREAESANAAKSAFLATMSHELRTPLNAIAGYVELLSLELRGPITDAQRQDLTRLRRNQQHLLSLINDVLHFAKLNAGQLRHEIQQVRVQSLLAQLEDLIAPQIASKGLRYWLRGCACEQDALADPEKLQQIVLNLVSNAVKYTERGGTVEVWCESLTGYQSDALSGSGGRVRIHVRDSGIGIPDDRLESIFDPFVQVDRRLTSVHEGIGLGLAISRELARAMGGDISVASELGRGSTFTVSLPAAARRSAVPQT